MKRLGTVLCVVVVALALGTANASGPDANTPKFATSKLRGSYGLSHEVGVATQRQFTELALVRFDGRGKCAFRLIPNGLGMPVDDVNSVSCAYAVSKEGVGTMDVVGDDGLAFTITFVLIDGGKGFRYMFNAPTGIQGIGEGSRQ